MDSLAETAFADGFPLLIITKESIKSVNDRLADGNELDFPGQQVSPLNFRGNVVLGISLHEIHHRQLASSNSRRRNSR